jgi:peroxiredoxin Q/BCP
MKFLAVLLAVAVPLPAFAALSVGDRAPAVSVTGVQGSESKVVDLSDLTKKGRAVVFFMPSVFNAGSTAECREFAESLDRFRIAGVTIIGMSRDPMDTLSRFSLDCASKFTIAFADMRVVTDFDVNDSANFTTRTTYVIGKGGRVEFVWDDDDYSGHFKRTLAFIEGSTAG